MSSHNFGKTICSKAELLYVPRPSLALLCMVSVQTTLSIVFVVYATLLAVIRNFMSHNIYLKLLRWFSCWPVIVEACPSETCGGHTGVETDFSRSTSVFCCCCYSTSAAYLYLIQLPLRLYNLSDWQHH